MTYFSLKFPQNTERNDNIKIPKYLLFSYIHKKYNGRRIVLIKFLMKESFAHVK